MRSVQAFHRNIKLIAGWYSHRTGQYRINDK